MVLVVVVLVPTVVPTSVEDCDVPNLVSGNEVEITVNEDKRSVFTLYHSTILYWRPVFRTL